MVTGGHGVRMQYDYTHDIAGIAGRGLGGSAALAAADPRRRHRSPATTRPTAATGRRIGAVHLAGLPATVQVGMFATSPDHIRICNTWAGGPEATARASPPAPSTMSTSAAQRSAAGGTGPRWAATASRARVAGDRISRDRRRVHRHRLRRHRARRRRQGGSDPGSGVERTLIGAFIGLIVAGRRGHPVHHHRVPARHDPHHLRRQPAPRPGARGQGRWSSAPSCFVAGLVAAAHRAPARRARAAREREHRLPGRHRSPKLRVIVGTAALLAVAAVLALALGDDPASQRRRGDGGHRADRAALHPRGRLRPARRPGGVAAAGDAGRRVRGPADARPRTRRSTAAYTPADGYFPLAPWAGFAVLCGYTACALGLAAYLLRRRDV